jgi:hypothetical protein
LRQMQNSRNNNELQTMFLGREEIGLNKTICSIALTISIVDVMAHFKGVEVETK